MTKNHWLIASTSMFKYASKFRKATHDMGWYKRGLACQAFALVYSDRAETGYKVRAA